MADAKIVVVGQDELALIKHLYNQIFSPGEDEEFFRRRFASRRNIALLVAEVDREPVGFTIGFELTPTTFFAWLIGVLPRVRRAGVATQLFQAEQAWAKDHDYNMIRFECQNQHRPMLHLAITEGYDLVGIRYDTDTGANVVIFEKELR
jgi:GNAT superfamily N-acetyltransferase